jgi:hypothetical protein
MMFRHLLSELLPVMYRRRRHFRAPVTGAALIGREKVLTGPAVQSLIQMQVEIRRENRVASGTGRFACLN